ncbi:efflux RND transporter periplasmic adaptor subunit [Candidatus Peregrinibacteria bacterium]|nr:efflux RND transporter periplasmic adaptor subunit [Candidatus Peregrinibacteria bacterium]
METGIFVKKMIKGLAAALAVGLVVLLTMMFINIFSKTEAQEIPVILPEVVLIEAADFKKEPVGVQAEGTVEAKEQAELKSQVNAPVAEIRVAVGDKVRKGDVLIVLANSDYQAQLMQMRFSLESAKAQLKGVQALKQVQSAKLSELVAGTRPEEMALSETKVKNALKTLSNSKISLENTRAKTQGDMAVILDGALAEMDKAVVVGLSALHVITEIQYHSFQQGAQERIKIANHKAEAIEMLLGETGTGEWIYEFIDPLSGGVRGKLSEIKNNPTEENVLATLSRMTEAMGKIMETLDIITQRNTLSQEAVANLLSAKNIVVAEKGALGGKEKAVMAQQIGNRNAIASSEIQMREAESALEMAQKELDIKRVGARKEQLEAQQAQLRQSEAAVIAQEAVVSQAAAGVSNFQALYEKTLIRAPISGVISAVPVKAGELVTLGQAVISLVNTDTLEIKSYLSEMDFTHIENKRIKEGSPVVIGESIKGKVSRIAPSLDPKTKKIEVDIEVADPDAGLIVGQNVTVGFANGQGGREPLEFYIPLQSVAVTSKGAFVYTVNQDSVVKEVSVKTGKVNGEFVEVKEGIDTGMRLLSSAAGMIPGQQVTVKKDGQ